MARVRKWFATSFPGPAAHDPSGAQLRLAIPQPPAETANVDSFEYERSIDPSERISDMLGDHKEELEIPTTRSASLHSRMSSWMSFQGTGILDTIDAPPHLHLSLALYKRS
jgi:hypothetical protein